MLAYVKIRDVTVSSVLWGGGKFSQCRRQTTSCFGQKVSFLSASVKQSRGELGLQIPPMTPPMTARHPLHCTRLYRSRGRAKHTASGDWRTERQSL